MTRRRRRGFTLVEVMVALTLGAMVLATLGELMGAGMTAVRHLRIERSARDHDAEARAWLRTELGNAEAGAEGDVPFAGTSSSARFSTRTPTPSGWHVRDVIQLGWEDSAVVMRSRVLGKMTFWSGVTALRMDYLDQPGASSRWFAAHESPVATPVAIRLRVERQGSVDTVLVPVAR